VLPGGTPREGESMAACARRELLEETGISANLSQVALVVDSETPGSSGRSLDIVFLASERTLGMELPRELGMGPHFVSADQLPNLVLHPPLAARLIRLLDTGAQQYVPYAPNWVQ